MNNKQAIRQQAAHRLDQGAGDGRYRVALCGHLVRELIAADLLEVDLLCCSVHGLPFGWVSQVVTVPRIAVCGRVLVLGCSDL